MLAEDGISPPSQAFIVDLILVVVADQWLKGVSKKERVEDQDSEAVEI